MSSLNRVILVGNLGKDPELNHTGGGVAVCNMTLATSEVIVDKKTNEKKEQTEWHNVVVWSKAAANCAKYLKKGSKICVEGSLKTESYEKDGIKKWSTKIIAQRVIFLSQPRGAEAQGAGGDHSFPQAEDMPAMPDNMDQFSEIPF